MQLQGQNSKDVDAVAALKINDARLSAKEQAMLDYVKVLTLEPWKVRDLHAEKLRKAGWSDEQMFEIAFITSLFAFTNRMADAHGLNYPSKGWLPPEIRQAEHANLPVKSTP